LELLCHNQQCLVVWCSLQDSSAGRILRMMQAKSSAAIWNEEGQSSHVLPQNWEKRERKWETRSQQLMMVAALVGSPSTRCFRRAQVCSGAKKKRYLGDVCTGWIDHVCVVRSVPSSFSSFETFFKREVKQGGDQNARAMAHNFLRNSRKIPRPGTGNRRTEKCPGEESSFLY
jgi:hypothetical protein